MNHPWQQPIRPLEVQYLHPSNTDASWWPVLFIRPASNEGEWEAITFHGLHYESADGADIRTAP